MRCTLGWDPSSIQVSVEINQLTNQQMGTCENITSLAEVIIILLEKIISQIFLIKITNWLVKDLQLLFVAQKCLLSRTALLSHGLSWNSREIMTALSFHFQMTQADVSGFGMSMVSPRTSRDTQERNVPLIRLNDVADLRVWRTSMYDATIVLCCAMGPPLTKPQILTGELYRIHYLQEKRIKLHCAAV